MDIRHAVGVKVGIANSKLEALSEYRTNPEFTERERVALEYAEQITRDDQEVSDACFARLREHLKQMIAQSGVAGFFMPPKMAAKPPADPKTQGPATVRIDLEGIGQRILATAVPAADYSALIPGSAGTLFFAETPRAAGNPALIVHRYQLRERKATPFIEGVRSYTLSGEKLVDDAGPRLPGLFSGAVARVVVHHHDLVDDAGDEEVLDGGADRERLVVRRQDDGNGFPSVHI